MTFLPRVAFLAVIGLAACDATPAVHQGASRSPWSSPSPVIIAAPVVTPPPGCPVTLPGSAGDPPFPREAMFGGGTSFGNKALWVGLWPGGVVAASLDFVEPDGSVRMKFGWYRLAEGKLSITGRRLDGAAAPLGSDVPDGYGPSGFQASGVFFPAEGCWEVTGHVGVESMTFVTYVVKVPG